MGLGGQPLDEATFRSYVEQSVDVIFVLDAEGRFVYASPAWERHFGLPVSACLGQSFALFLHPEDVGPCAAHMTRVFSSGQAGSSPPFRVHHVDGSWRWFLVNGSTLVTPGGEVQFLGVGHDITESRRAEEAFRENQEQLRVIFEASKAGIILVSERGVITFANQCMADMFGMSLQSLLGTTYPDHLDASEKAHGDQRMRMIITGEIEFVSVERKFRRADGTTFWGHLSGRRMEQPDGSLRALVGIITDITKRREAEEQQRLLQAQLNHAQKMESLGSLAGGVAHDMNNVLGAILGLASAHLETQPPGNPAWGAFNTIIKAAERGGNMLKSLLSFARQSAAEEQVLDLNTILQEEVHLLEHTTLARVRLVLELDPDLRPIRGDVGALTHAFMNLCVNAVDAMPEPGTLTLRTRNLGVDWVEVQVQDTGTGMPQDILAKAVDPFFTTKEVGKGTGLGLSIVYSTMKTHQGEMELKSEPGQGTCVCLRFPVCEGLAPVQETSDMGGNLPARGQLRVLLADDDEMIRGSMEGMLAFLGHEVHLAASGEEALEALEGGLLPDVVVLDMNMPGLGGAGTLPLLRLLLPRVPVLLATGRADQTAQDLVASHPLVYLLPKPFGLQVLRASLAPFLGG
jgi:PAS domain S-box-containing protein